MAYDDRNSAHRPSNPSYASHHSQRAPQSSHGQPSRGGWQQSQAQHRQQPPQQLAGQAPVESAYAQPAYHQRMYDEPPYQQPAYSHPAQPRSQPFPYQQESARYYDQQPYEQVDNRHGARVEGSYPNGGMSGQSHVTNDQAYDQHRQVRQDNHRPPQSVPVPRHHHPQPSADAFTMDHQPHAARRRGTDVGNAQTISRDNANERNVPPNQDRGRDSSSRKPQLREKSAPPARRKPFIEPPSSEVMSWDNAFPTFPTKKEVAKAKIRESLDQSSTKSGSPAREHVRPSTAGASASRKGFHGSTENVNLPNQLNGSARNGQRTTDDANTRPRQSLDDHRIMRPNVSLGAPQLSTLSLPERTVMTEAPQQQNSSLALAHHSRQQNPSDRQIPTILNNSQPSSRPRPAIPPIATGRSLTYQDSTHAGQGNQMAAPRRPATATSQPLIQQTLPTRHPVSASSLQSHKPWTDQRQRHEGSGDFYGGSNALDAAPQGRTASMLREEQIEADMPDFDGPAHPPKTAHQRGLTIDKHLNDVHLAADLPPLPNSKQNKRQSPPSPAPAPAYVKPGYQSAGHAVTRSDFSERKDVPVDMTGFVFDIPSESTPHAPQPHLYQSPAPPARAPNVGIARAETHPGPAVGASVAPSGFEMAPMSRQQVPQPQHQSTPVSQYPPHNPSHHIPQNFAPHPAQGRRQHPPLQHPPQQYPPQQYPPQQYPPQQYPPQHYPPQQYSPQNSSRYHAQQPAQYPQSGGPRRDAYQQPMRDFQEQQRPSPPLQQQQRSMTTRSNPDSLPPHPTPVRPGLQDASPLQESRPSPVRHPDQTSVASTTPRPSIPPSSSSSGEARQPLVVTNEELAMLRTKVEKNPHDNKTALVLVKKLVEASSVLASENGRLDAKSTAKNRERYIDDAHKRVKRLVSAGYPDAMFYLADCYGQGKLGLAVDTKEAFSLYQSAAKAGHAGAAYRTAMCCEIGPEEGGGTRKDPTKAVQWYRRAAQLHDGVAMYKLGAILLRGLLGQPKNITEAVVWLKQAAELADAENPHALHELGLIHDPANTDPAIREKIKADEKYAGELFKKAATLGYKSSQSRLGQAYEYGGLGLLVDPRKSIAWYARAAAQGEHDAELALSGWYLTGVEGILEHSDTEAYLWARKAALSSESGKAMFAMGYYTENGIGCSASLEDAKRWYGRAASLRFPKAQERLEELRKNGNRAPRPKPVEGRLRRDQKRDEAECLVM